MSDHPRPERLEEYVDGLLDETASGEVEAHLAECAACHEEADRARALVARAAALPRRVEPRNDLWPAIRAAARESSVAQVGVLGRSMLEPRWWRVAVALLLIAASSATTALVLRRRPALPAVPAARPAVMPARVARLETRYEVAVRELESDVDARRSVLSPATIAAVTRSLGVIDSAIAEARAALARDPRNAALQQLLNASYERKVDLLARAARLEAGT